MQSLVTGCAGFIGSQLTEAVLEAGHSVRGVDAFTDYYDPAIKRRNVSDSASSDRFELIEDDLCSTDLAPLLDGVDTVFHLAGQPGVRVSWSDGFPLYVAQNVLATQRGSAHYPSMLEDVEAHRKTEIDLITGSLVRAARRAGVPVPLHETMERLIKAKEDSW